MIKMIKMIFSICNMIFFIFQDLITIYDNFMTLGYQANNLLRYKMICLFISNLKSLYAFINIYECMLNMVYMIEIIFYTIFLTYLFFFGIFFSQNHIEMNCIY